MKKGVFSPGRGVLLFPASKGEFLNMQVDSLQFAVLTGSKTIPLRSVMSKAKPALFSPCFWGALVHWHRALAVVYNLQRIFKLIDLIIVYQDYHSLSFNLGIGLLSVQGINENTDLVLLNWELLDMSGFLGILRYLFWGFCFPKPQPLAPQEGASF